MSDDAKSVIDAFEHLPPAEREQVLRELLRRMPVAYEGVTDEDLVAAADALFVELDRAERS